MMPIIMLIYHTRKAVNGLADGSFSSNEYALFKDESFCLKQQCERRGEEEFQKKKKVPIAELLHEVEFLVLN